MKSFNFSTKHAQFIRKFNYNFGRMMEKKTNFAKAISNLHYKLSACWAKVLVFSCDGSLVGIFLLHVLEILDAMKKWIKFLSFIQVWQIKKSWVCSITRWVKLTQHGHVHLDLVFYVLMLVSLHVFANLQWH